MGVNISNGVLDGARRIGAKVRDVAIGGGLPGAPLGYRLRGATQSGAPESGTWRTGDVVPDRRGAIWTCTAGGTPGTWTAAGWEPWQFHVSPLGGGADDTANLQAAINSAAAYMANNQGYAEVLVDPGLYTLSSPLTHAGSGYSQLYLPVIGDSVTSGTLVIRCTSGNGAPMPYFDQTVAQRTGAVFKSTLTGQTYSGSYGTPAILGGPTPEQGYGQDTGYPGVVFDNLHIIIDGITLTPPLDPTVSGFYFRGLGKMTVLSAAYIPDATVSQFRSTRPSSSYATGLYAPFTLNNDNVEVVTFTAYGAAYGAIGCEHFNAKGLRTIYCENGFGAFLGNYGNHGMHIDYYSCEGCQNGVVVAATSGTPYTNVPVSIDLMDCEFISYYTSGGYHISDPSNLASGTVHLHETGGATSFGVNGASGMEILSASQPRGHVTAPSVPASGTALTNPFWRHAYVIVTGGNVTGISVDGQATGLTAGTVAVPSGKTITLTYTSAPSWGWWLI